jgi:hypothetical protein
MAREIRSYDYVNHPYERVRGVLQQDAAATFRAATRSASARANEVAAALRVEIAGFEVVKDVLIEVAGSNEARDPRLKTMVTRIGLSWAAAANRHLFPLMRAELAVYALSATETQLDFLGHYDPPLGPLGDAIDAVLGRRIAEASVHRFLGDVAAYLRAQLGGS